MRWLFASIAGLITVVLARYRDWIYDFLIPSFTTGLYTSALELLPDWARVLDVGIGTGRALANNGALVKAKHLSIVGVDIDLDYVKRAKDVLLHAGLSRNVRVEHISVYEFAERGFDAVYFSDSFMLLPDKVKALKHVCGLLNTESKGKPGAGPKVIFTQTFEKNRSKLAEWGKVVLTKVTSINFGTVTYQDDFEKIIAQAGMKIDNMKVLSPGRWRDLVLVTASKA
jgi:SAM-dependent methyltransferase